MTSFYDNYDYYKKMLELQEKLRKSEEERIRLEERFKILIQESRNRHDACINRLRLRYIEFLEEQRTRDERNHQLLEALDRVDNSLALMTAKTDRLNVLKRQYEAYLRRIYTVPSPSGSIIDDSSITNQGEDRYPKRDVTGEQIHFSSEVANTVPFQTLQLNGQKDQLYLPSTVKSTKSPRSIHYNYCQRNIAQPRALNQRVNGQNILRSYPLISHNSEPIEQPPEQNLSSKNFQQRQYVETGRNLHVPYVSSGRSGSLTQQTFLHFDFNETMPERTEMAQNVSHFVIPERGDSTSQYKFLDVPQNRFASMTPRSFHLSSTVQSPRQENDKTFVNDTQTGSRGADETSPMKYLYRNNPAISSNLSKHASPNCFDYSRRKFDHFKIRQKPLGDTCARPLTTSDVSNMMKRYKRFIPKTSVSLSMDSNEAMVKKDECRTATIVENELDMYIDKIRKLQYDLNAQSLEEIDKERNVSSNVPDDTLSDNGNFRMSVKDKSKENLPKEVEKVLALADDLVSRTVDLNVTNDTKEEFTKEALTNEGRNYTEVVETVQGDISISERSYTELSITRSRPETLAMLAKDEISNDIKLHVPELDPHGYIGKTREENFNSQRQLPETERDEQQVVFDVSLDDKITEEGTKISKDEHNVVDNICIAAESNLDQYLFSTVEELEPWSLDLLQKRIKEIGLTCETENQFTDEKFVTDTLNLDQGIAKETESLNEIKTLESRYDAKDIGEVTNLNGLKDDSGQSVEYLESNNVFTNKNETEVNGAPALQNVEYNNESCTYTESVIQNIEPVKDQVGEQNELDNEREQEREKINFMLDTNQNNEQEITVQSDEYNDQGYYENFNQTDNYVKGYETEGADLNEKYSYDLNATYETNQTNDYNKDAPYEGNQEENYDPNASYEINHENCNSNESHEINQGQNYEGNVVYENDENQEYQEYVNQEYAEGLDEQYTEYVGEQYDSENQYEYDPNVQYQKDTNEQYAYSYDQQYDSHGVSDANVNQPLAYSDYDPNQTIEEEDRENQEDAELQKESKSQDVEEKLVDLAQAKSERSSIENGAQKKKDTNKSLLDSDTDSTIERNVSNTESDFDFN